MMDFEDFHIVANKDVSDRIATLLRLAGIRILPRVIMAIGRPEYVIAVHIDDLERAEEVFLKDIGPGCPDSQAPRQG